MIFDDLGLPRVSGASDLQDSAALAGIMTAFGWPRKIYLSYYVLKPGRYVRHPDEIKYDFSRDQAICLMAGLRVQSQSKEFENATDFKKCIDEDFITGKDILSPSVKGHFRRCRGESASFLQDAWFWADLWFSAKFKPLDELNQLFCMMKVADKKFMRYYCEANPQWREALRIYWYKDEGAWRDEKDLCEWMINEIHKEIYKD